jgi:Uncharacterized ATPase, putative transposase
VKRDIFVETQHVVALRNAVISALEAGKGYPAMVMTYGEAGTGKTMAAQSLYSEFGGFYQRVFEGMSLAAFLQELCYKVNGSQPHGANRCRQSLMASLGKARALFIDEADRLHVSCLEALRDIHDETGSPVILIGELGLPSRVSARNRINDRIPDAFRVHFDRIGKTDIALYASESADLALSPEAASVIHTETGGNFRRVHNAVLSLDNAARADGRRDIDADFARAVFSVNVKRGRA